MARYKSVKLKKEITCTSCGYRVIKGSVVWIMKRWLRKATYFCPSCYKLKVLK